MPGRLMQLCYCFVGPPQIPDVAESVTFVGEVVSRELMKLWKREQVEADEKEDERNDNQFYRFCRTGLLCHSTLWLKTVRPASARSFLRMTCN